MTPDPHAGLSAREREIMDIIHRLGHATTVDIHERMQRAPKNATVRSTLRALEEKGRLEHYREGARFVYKPVASTEQTRRTAVNHLVRTFFDGSPADAVAILVKEGTKLKPSERKRIAELLRGLESNDNDE